MHDCLEELAYECGYRVCGVADELGVSERYLRELFRRDVGPAPKDWMRLERMVVARRLLGCGLDPMAVAGLLGFADCNGFRREFQLMYGTSPVRYREFRMNGCVRLE